MMGTEKTAESKKSIILIGILAVILCVQILLIRRVDDAYNQMNLISEQAAQKMEAGSIYDLKVLGILNEIKDR